MKQVPSVAAAAGLVIAGHCGECVPVDNLECVGNVRVNAS